MNIIPFVNRKNEKSKLEEILKHDTASLIVIYGRRRIGKSELVKTLLTQEDIYFLAAKKDISAQLSDLAKVIDKNIKGFSSVNYPDIRVLLENLNRFITKKTILVLDEFNYLIESNESVLSEINTFWETTSDKKLSIILCGSVRKLMEKIAGDYTAPLYGRTDCIMHLKPIKPGWLMDALNINSRTSVELYSVLGGIPRYWEYAKKFNCCKLETAILKLFFEKDSPLRKEPELILQDDLKNSIQYYTILSVIGGKLFRAGDISNRTGISPTSLSKPLNILLEMNYIEKEIRFMDEPKKAKNTLYKIADPFLGFYFNFVESYRSELEMDLGKEVLESIIKGVTTYVSITWENLCRQSIPYLKVNNINWRNAQRWWGKALDGTDIEIDLLAESFDGNSVLVGEVKWTDNIDINTELNYLKNRIQMMPKFPKNKNIVFVIFLRENLKKLKSKDCAIYSSSDVMNALK